MSTHKKIFSKRIKLPWMLEQTAALNLYQRKGLGHPYTCGFNRKDENHLDGEGILVATENGWICPYCDYKQDWAMNYSMRIDEETEKRL